MLFRSGCKGRGIGGLNGHYKQVSDVGKGLEQEQRRDGDEVYGRDGQE